MSNTLGVGISDGQRISGWAIVHGVCRSILAAVFLIAGLSKLRNPYAFLVAVYQFELLTAEQARFVATFLPFLEIALGGCLILGLFTRAASVVATVLLAAFTGILASVVVRGIKTACGCFGELEPADIGWTTVARSVALTVLGVLTIYTVATASHRNSVTV